MPLEHEQQPTPPSPVTAVRKGSATYMLPPEESGVQPAPAAPKPSQHPAWLLEAAAAAGVSERTIGLSSPEELREAVAFRSGQNRPAPGPAVPPPPAPEPEDIVDWGEVDDEDADGKPIKRKATESDVAAPIARVVRRQAETIRELKDTVEHLARAHITAGAHRIDEAFASMPPEYAAIFGTGSVTSLPTDSEQRQARIDALRLAKIDTTNPPSPAALQKQIIAAVKRFNVAAASPPPPPAAPANPYAAAQNGTNGHSAPSAKPTPGRDATGKFVAHKDDEDAELRAAQDRWVQGQLNPPTGREERESADPRQAAVDAIRKQHGEKFN